MKKTFFTSLILSFLIILPARADIELEKLVLPDGFSIEVYARIPKARQMALGDDGTVYVGTRGDARGRVFAITDNNGDYKADDVAVITRGLKQPSGLTYKDGDLYVADIDTLYLFNNISSTMNDSPEAEIITDNLPDKTHHGWKFIDFGPDDLLYVPIGAPCNICEPEEIFAAIHTIDVNNPDESLTKIASGVRNTVGFDWDPKTNELWFTDNGGDNLGDEMPADELNKISKPGEHFGYPYIHQGDFQDPQFGSGKKASDYTPPAQKLAPHAGATGMAFYKGDMLPKTFKNNIIIAEHGSWNRTEEAGHTGHMLTLVTVENGKAVKYEPFVTGFLQNNEAWGRPTDVLELKDGSLLVADDEAGAVYRITYMK